MAQHLSQAQIQTLLAITPTGALLPSQLRQLIDALERVKHVENEQGTNESSLATIFPSTAPNP